MSATHDCPLAQVLAQHLRAAREELVRRWLERIVDRVTIEPNRVFPTSELLDHMPLLIDGIAGYLEDPSDEITTDAPVTAKAIELGDLRHRQGFGPQEILKEYEILGGIMFAYLTRVVSDLSDPCTPGELLACSHRLFRAIAVIQQVTTMQYLHLSDQLVRDREARLRGFNRAISHEMKNRIGAASGAVSMIQEDWIIQDEKQVRRFASLASRNLTAMQDVLENLIELSRMDTTAVRERNVLLPDVVREVKRQLRDFAEARGVRVEISEELPYIEVPAAALELALSNYVSNAVKYRDPESPDPWVRVEGELVTDVVCEVVVRVRDNGLGVPAEARAHLFERFFRAHEETITGEEGSGLGLAIVRETVASMGGRVWAEFPECGSVFALSVPCDRMAGGEG